MSIALSAVDALPLIVLAKVGRLDLLTAGGYQVSVTETVYQEVLAGDPKDPARLALIGGFGVRTPNVAVPAALAAWPGWNSLDAGEEATLALAFATSALAILDDGDARRAARALGIPHTGTTGLVMQGKRQGIVTSAAQTLQALKQAGLFLPSETLLRAELALVGETWP